jgi:hypothetical protein
VSKARTVRKISAAEFWQVDWAQCTEKKRITTNLANTTNVCFASVQGAERLDWAQCTEKKKRITTNLTNTTNVCFASVGGA